MKETKTCTKVHFTVEGRWLTWMLRHLWIEGNEVKSLRMWIETFPEYSSRSLINKTFLPIVTGKKKFIGTSDSPGMEMVDDNQKYWDSDQSGEGNKAYPLLQSWNDVIYLKKLQMYIKELSLLSFKMNRQFPAFKEDEGNLYSNRWQRAAELNEMENPLRIEIADLYGTIKNISEMFQLNIPFIEYPTTTSILPTTRMDKSESYKGTTGKSGVIEGMEVVEFVWSKLSAGKKYFKRKYGIDMLFISKDDIKRMFCLPDEDKPYWKGEYVKNEELLEEIYTKISKTNSLLNKEPKTMDVNNYVQMVIDETKRTKFDPENPCKTTYESGWIDREGKFYGCGYIQHRNFSEELCKYLNIKTEITNKASFIDDAQITLENKGWVKVSSIQFYWNDFKHKLTEQQISTIIELVINFGQTTIFENFHKVSIEDFIKDNSEVQK